MTTCKPSTTARCFSNFTALIVRCMPSPRPLCSTRRKVRAETCKPSSARCLSETCEPNKPR